MVMSQSPLRSSQYHRPDGMGASHRTQTPPLTGRRAPLADVTTAPLSPGPTAQQRSPPNAHGQPRCAAGPHAMPLATRSMSGGARAGGGGLAQGAASRAVGQAAGGLRRAVATMLPAGAGQWQSRGVLQKPSALQQASPVGHDPGRVHRFGRSSAPVVRDVICWLLTSPEGKIMLVRGGLIRRVYCACV